MSTNTISGKASDRAHEVVNKLETTMSGVEDRVKEASSQASNTADTLSKEAQSKAKDTLQEIEQFVREKPIQAAGIAFAAGILTTLLLRRR